MKALQRICFGIGGMVCILLLWGCPSTVTTKKDPDNKQTETVKIRTPEDFQREAAAMYEQGKEAGNVPYEQVSKLYRQALEQNSSLIPARFNLAALYEEMGRYKEAADLFSDILRQQEKHVEATYRLAQVLVRLKQYSGAVHRLRSYMALVPQQKENPDMLLNLASVMVASGEREEALKYARSTLAIDPTNIKAYRIIARVYLNQRRYAGVLLVHEMATERTKKQDATLENIRGLAYLGQKEYPLALFAFEQAVKLDPSLFAAQMNLGILAMRYHDNNRSLNALQAASRLRPRNRDALMAYAVALRANKRFADAENVYLKQLLAVNPRDTDSMFNVGLLYVKFMNRPKDGSTYLRRFIGERNEQVPNNHIAYQLLQQAQQAIKMEEQMKQQQKQEQQKPKEQKPKEQKPKEQKPKEQKPKV